MVESKRRNRKNAEAPFVNQKGIFVGAVSRSPILHDSQAASGNLVDYPVVEQEHAIGNIFFQSVPGENAFAALGGNHRSYSFVFKPAKQPPQFRPQNTLILKSGEQVLDGIQNNALRAYGIDRGSQPYEKAFQIVIAGFINLAAFDTNIIDDEPLFLHQLVQVITKRAHILRKLGGR